MHARTSIADLKSALRRFTTGLLSVWRATRLGEAVAYAIGVMLVMFPIAGVSQLLNWALALESIWLAMTIVTVCLAALLFAAALIANEQFLRDVHLQGIQWPSLLSIGVAWLAVVVFGGLSCGFERLGYVNIEPAVPFTEGCASRYADMYLWHLFDSIPGIDFTETVRWTQQYTYSDSLSGWLLLAFKVLVFVSVIRSFVASGRVRREVRTERDARSTVAADEPALANRGPQSSSGIL